MESKNHKREHLLFNARRRGKKEIELILEAFVKDFLDRSNEIEEKELEDFLNLSDMELEDFFFKDKTLSIKFINIGNRIKSFIDKYKST